MFNSDCEKGKVILIVTLVLFLYYTIWVIGLPFIDDNRVQSLFGSHNLALIIPAVLGLCFVGGLVLFTIYHIWPYFSYDKFSKLHES
ncbi:dolichol phosphate-mannose biosynthesis regulatory protein [Colletes gigas]|uniref:dolichol phosphate-mannose biosynthesis regulatory protein n=1 Tax=Colletes gigas TaxID=935657 RepID=UPI001C9AB544|nr:dolichol phosphate-mannose biosynthesis regulatory protein [Colletes gigas]